MIKRIAMTLALMAVVAGAWAKPSAQQVLDAAVAAIDRAGGITATYTIATAQGNSRGTFAMNGNKFRVLSPEVKCWYDGHDQWAYSPVTGEVNITTPSAQELQMTNPLIAARYLKQGCTVSFAPRQPDGAYSLVLVPRQRADVKGITLDFARDDYRLLTAVFVMRDGSTIAIALRDYKTGVALPASTFTYDPTQVPAGTQVADLR